MCNQVSKIHKLWFIFPTNSNAPSDGFGEPAEEVEGGVPYHGGEVAASVPAGPAQAAHDVEHLELELRRGNTDTLWLHVSLAVGQTARISERRLNVQLADDVISDVSHSN